MPPGAGVVAAARRGEHDQRNCGSGDERVKRGSTVLVAVHGVLLVCSDEASLGSPAGRDRISVLRDVTPIASGSYASGRMCGKRMTSRIDALSVSSITSRSIPRPPPAVGGRPYSKARM